MAEPAVAVLDVGHGNCAVVIDSKGTVVIDAGRGSTLLEFLETEGVTKVDVLLISHADEDHIDGVISLLESGTVKVDLVHLNSDAMKGTALWDDLTLLLDKANSANRLKFEVSLTTNHTGSFDQGTVRIEVLAPSPGLAAKGPGSTDHKGRRLTSNSASAVFRLKRDGVPTMLFPGDLDDVGFENLLESGQDVRASVLVFPHHGGAGTRGDVTGFAQRVCEAVSPDNVIFSIGRGKYATPRPEIVTAIRQLAPRARILCTQLSEHCASAVPAQDPTHLTDKISQGRELRKCCAGTIVIRLGHPEPGLLPVLDAHREFIAKMAPNALCMRPISKG